MQLSSNDIRGIRGIAEANGVDPAALMAIIRVESNGVTGANIDGDMMPVIRWEGHYFDRLVPAEKRAAARRAGLASPKAQAIKNPRSQRARYVMLTEAMDIDRDAAIMSCSWAVGQVMGAHWEKLGFSSPTELYRRACESVTGQVDLMMRYIVRFGLLDELQRRDWSGFARGYNGPNYRKFKYDTKMADAYRHYSGGEDSTITSGAGMLRMGSKGKAVREVQTLLVRAGANLKVDGDFGPSTRGAVRWFQETEGLKVDGVVGPETMRVLSALRSTADEDVGATPVTDNPDVRKGAMSAIGGVSIATAAERIESVADRIGYTGIPWLDHTATGLYALAGILVVGGIAYGAYRAFQGGRTFEGIG